MGAIINTHEKTHHRAEVSLKEEEILDKIVPEAQACTVISTTTEESVRMKVKPRVVDSYTDSRKIAVTMGNVLEECALSSITISLF